MNRKEALTRLRLRSHQAFCEYVENGSQENEEAALDVLAYDMAIAALREKQQRDEGCEWCEEENLDVEYYYTLPTAPRSFQTRRSYCHKCGRELSGNAEQVKEGEG